MRALSERDAGRRSRGAGAHERSNAALRARGGRGALLPLLVVAALGGGPPLAATADESSTDPCTAVDRSDAVALLLCDADTTDAEWREAGREVCGAGFGACNAWIWLDAAALPESAPTTDAALPKERTGKAAAIWVGTAESLILVRPVRAEDATR